MTVPVVAPVLPVETPELEIFIPANVLAVLSSVEEESVVPAQEAVPALTSPAPRTDEVKSTGSADKVTWEFVDDLSAHLDKDGTISLLERVETLSHFEKNIGQPFSAEMMDKITKLHYDTSQITFAAEEKTLERTAPTPTKTAGIKRLSAQQKASLMAQEFRSQQDGSWQVTLPMGSSRNDWPGQIVQGQTPGVQTIEKPISIGVVDADMLREISDVGPVYDLRTSEEQPKSLRQMRHERRELKQANQEAKKQRRVVKPRQNHTLEKLQRRSQIRLAIKQKKHARLSRIRARKRIQMKGVPEYQDQHAYARGGSKGRKAIWLVDCPPDDCGDEKPSMSKTALRRQLRKLAKGDSSVTICAIKPSPKD